MTYGSISVVYGLLLTREEVLRIKNVTFQDLGRWGPFVDGYCLFTWPCCSRLNRKKFILGKKLGTYDFDKVFERVIGYNIEQPPIEYDSSLLELADKYRVSRKIRNIVLMDDCNSCT